ncbi:MULTISPECIES: class A beta-lactamase [unclassified Bradyrhizobium]|uniref:class A beta-lactamase n=1 Tax=unclassified Bradyrhizobium TaxID=2631580 RepID=UPI00244A238F|nr:MULTISPECIES: class A beta-lactamase [unclassified Bradyrhizobium]MDH2348511.1 class A beta-lactamase [Bradyrhizobium sp. SSUT77]MDH2357017.1 class A beta-lactamase [Bradyrhizobium sp. SSUT112]
MLNRRLFTNAALATAGGWLLDGTKVFAQRSGAWSDELAGNLEKLEKERGGRLGVAIVDTQSTRQGGYRSEERFPMCSTFKLLAVAAVLTRVDKGNDQLDRRIKFESTEVVVDSPVTKNRAGGDGMTLAEICQAAMTFSDDTAGNLLLSTLGGPDGLTAYARSLGDTVTRLDRIEPDLNESIPGDLRDTTSPAAMLSNIRRLVAGSALTPVSKDRLTGWLVGNKTGDKRLRAGLPRNWRIGDKTGAGERGTTNDVAVLWPSPDQPPVFVSVYLTGSSVDGEHRNATLAMVGAAIMRSLA